MHGLITSPPVLKKCSDKEFIRCNKKFSEKFFTSRYNAKNELFLITPPCKTLRRFCLLTSLPCTIYITFNKKIHKGASVGPIVEWLNVKKEDQEKRGMDEEVVYRAIDHVVSGIEDVIGHHGMHWWMHKMAEFNAKHINPIFTRDAWRLADQEILDIYHRFKVKF